MYSYLSNLNYKKKIYLIYIVFILLIVSFSIIFTFFLINKGFGFIDKDLNIILKEIPFNWGDLTHNINENFSFHSTMFEKEFYLKKFPLNAILIVLIFKISKNIYFFLIIKNILISSVIFSSVYFFSKKMELNFIHFLAVLISFFLIPYNTIVIFHFVYADHLTSFLLPLIFIFLISNLSLKYFFISLIIFVLYFTKPSIFFVCTIIPIVIIILEKKSLVKYLPLLFSLLAIITWGSYGFNKTGVFPFGKNLLSNNSYDFSAITNKKFVEIYPNQSVDSLVDSVDINFNQDYKLFEDEWDFYNYFNNRNQYYLTNNFSSYLRTIPLKIKFIFFGINKDGIDSDEFEKTGIKIRYSNIFNKIILNLAIIISLFLLFKNSKNFLQQKHELYYLSILSLNILPLIYAWATTKHLVGIFILSNLYLLIKIFSFFDIEKKKFN